MASGTDSHFYGSRAGSHPERPHRRPGTIPGAGDTYTTRCARLSRALNLPPPCVGQNSDKPKRLWRNGRLVEMSLS
eukprot:scaffold41112_cov32-Phaeocystis_antarctica.AAC.1